LENKMPLKTENIKWLVLLSLLIGAVLRLSFPGDIEYKEDEKYMFDASQAIGVTQPWPELGMVSGGQVKNPGMSVWVFVGLARVFHATNPIELARAVQCMNILALGLLAFFALRIVPEKERLPWAWAMAFASVTPIAVLFQRKLWAQSTLPLFCVLLWIAWYYRKERIGAFFWGFLVLCIAQIHMSGFFLGTGLFLWTVYRDSQTESGGLTRWGYWLAGSLAGMVPMIPWVTYVVSNLGKSAGSFKFFWLFYPKFWIYWLIDALGLGMSHSLGKEGFLDFLRYPLVDGMATYLVALAHVLAILAGIRMLVVAKREGGAGFFKMPEGTRTGPLVEALLIAVGLLMTLACFRIYQHYLIMSFPLQWVWLAWVGSRAPRVGPRYLALIWGLQLFITVAFLGYIHVNHGVPMGDYGTVFQYQDP
jgi:hypothetical protein